MALVFDFGSFVTVEEGVLSALALSVSSTASVAAAKTAARSLSAQPVCREVCWRCLVYYEGRQFSLRYHEEWWPWFNTPPANLLCHHFQNVIRVQQRVEIALHELESAHVEGAD